VRREGAAPLAFAVLVVGLTGGIGAGKSTVAQLLAARGARVVDVDALGRKVLEPGGRAEAAVVAAFGPRVVGPDGAIDRASLASIVFSDAASLSRLTALSHPAINEEIVEQLRSMPDGSIVVLDLAVLAESDLGKVEDPYGYTFVVTVEASPAVREERAVQRGSSRDDVRRRMAQQATDEQRRALADVVIVNEGDRDHLVEQVDRLWGHLVELNRARAAGQGTPAAGGSPAG